MIEILLMVIDVGAIILLMRNIVQCEKVTSKSTLGFFNFNTIGKSESESK